MRISFNQKLLALSFIIILGISFTGYMVYRSNQRQLASAIAIQHTQKVIYQAGHILSLVQDIETSARGFIITNDSSFLTPAFTADTAVFSSIGILRTLLNNSTQKQSIDSLSLYVKQRIDFSHHSMTIRSKQGLLAASLFISQGQGQQITGRIRQITNSIQQQANILLQQKRQTNAKSIAVFNKVLLAMYILLVVFSIALFFITSNYTIQQQTHDAEIMLWNEELESRMEQIAGFKSLFESAPGLYLILLPNLVIDAVSDEYLSATMTRRNEILGKYLFDVFPDNPDDPAANGVSNLHASLQTVIATKKQHGMPIQKYDVRRADGTFEEKYWSPLNKPVLNEKCELVYIIHSVEDITARIQNERELLRATNEIKDLYDNAPCGYFSVNQAIDISNINQTLLQWLDYSAEEVIGKKKYEDLLAPESKERYLSTFKEAFAGYIKNGAVNDLEFDFERKDGSTFPAVVNSTAVLDAQGNFVKSRSTVFDNTEHKKAEERLKTANKELEAFSYSISHDLRAPLRAVHGYTKILFEDYNTQLDDGAKRLMNNIVSNAEKMGQLIDDLLNFSRLARQEITKLPVSMQHIVNNICNDTKNETRQNNLQFIIKPLPLANADSRAIKQVWVNLIANAVKYSGQKENAVVEIGGFDHDEQVIYYIKDNGVGFDMKYIHKLFGVFQRLHTGRDFEGTGVGLAIVQNIVTRHGGAVWAIAKKNEGANFYFSLPKIIQQV